VTLAWQRNACQGRQLDKLCFFGECEFASLGLLIKLQLLRNVVVAVVIYPTTMGRGSSHLPDVHSIHSYVVVSTEECCIWQTLALKGCAGSMLQTVRPSMILFDASGGRQAVNEWTAQG